MLERKLFPAEKAFLEARPKFEDEFAARTAKLIEKLKGR